jgi:hypothetical protein
MGKRLSIACRSPLRVVADGGKVVQYDRLEMDRVVPKCVA